MSKPSWLDESLSPKAKAATKPVDLDLGLGGARKSSASELDLGLGSSRKSSNAADDLFGAAASGLGSLKIGGPVAGRRAGGSVSAAPEKIFAARTQEIKYPELTFGEEISGGGFCILYRGTWGGKTVAIKKIFDPVLTAELMEEFSNEVAMLSELRHANIVNILASVSKPPNLCIITEYMARGSLYHVLHVSDVVLNPERIASVTSQIASAFQFIHGRGVVHRDIKSHNMLSDANLEIKVCDFGMARTEAFLASQKNFTATGTPPYMAPELFNKSMPSRGSDVYALGVLFWEIVSRDVPFDGMAPDAIAQLVKDGRRPDFGRQFPHGWKTLTESMWQKDSAKRPTIDAIYATMKQQFQ